MNGVSGEQEQESTALHGDELFYMHFALSSMLAKERCSSVPKLFTYYHIMCKQITLHSAVWRERAQAHIISSFITYGWHFMACTDSEALFDSI